MRTITILMLTALALAGCGSKNNATDTSNAMAAHDTMTVPSNDIANGPMGDNSMAGTTMATPDYVTKAATGDIYEIASSKLALTHTTSPALKKFAQSMIDGHMATTKALKSAIAKGGVIAALPTTVDAEHNGDLDKLTAAKGAEFDMLYKSQQTVAHMTALTVHQGYAETGNNAALKAFAANTAPKVQMHIDMLKAM